MKTPAKNIAFFHWFNFLLYFRPYWPVAVLYFQHITHSYAAAMSVFSVVFLTQAVLELPTGLISDYIGRKRTIIAGSFFSVLAITAYAIGMNIGVLALGGFLEGLARSLFRGTHDALVYETLKEQGAEKEFDHVLGRVSSRLQLGLGLSASLGALLALHSLSLVFWISVIPQVLCFIVCFFFQEPKHLERSQDHPLRMLKDAYKQFLRSRKLRLISLAEVLEFGVNEALFYFQAAFFKMVIPEWAIGFVRSFGHLCSGTSFWFSGPIIRRFGQRKTLISGNLLATVVETCALLWPTFLSPFFMASTSLAYGSGVTARSTIMQHEFSDKQRATMDSMVSLAGSIVFSLVSMLLGYVADITTPAHAMLLGLSSNIVVIGLYFSVFKKDAK